MTELFEYACERCGTHVLLTEDEYEALIPVQSRGWEGGEVRRRRAELKWGARVLCDDCKEDSHAA